MADENLFLQVIGDVKPLQQNKANIGKRLDKSASLEIRREAAIIDTRDENFLSTSFVKELSPHEIVSFKRTGVQDGVFKKLRLGKYEIDAQLDLHHLTVEQARKELFLFIKECMEYSLRTVMVLHGKSERDIERKAVLKSYAVYWLEDMHDVLAFHSAQQQHGGTGALYVMLRKSEKAKNINRERWGIR